VHDTPRGFGLAACYVKKGKGVVAIRGKFCSSRRVVSSLFLAILFVLPKTDALVAKEVTKSERKLDKNAQVYAPGPISRDADKSIHINRNWDSFIRFIVNRGPQKVHYLSEMLKVLDPKKIEKIKGFKGAWNTRITIMAYELRSREIVDRVEELLELGFKARFVVDADTVTEARNPTDKEWDSWSERQRAYWIHSNDADKDGAVSEGDLARVNFAKKQAVGLWKRLQKLKRKYRGKLELVTPPHEAVPVSDNFNYPRLQHWKEISIQFLKSGRTWNAPVVAYAGSANPSDSGMDKRVAMDPGNIEDYLQGEDFVYERNSQGHIQFGAIFGEKYQNPEALAALRGPVEDWIKLFKKGEHFDSYTPRDKHLPRIIFKDGSTLQAFFSEGIQKGGIKTIDPIWAVTKTLSRKDIRITSYYSGEFVMTHKGFARNVRSMLVMHKPENFGIFVDSTQANEAYSAIPDLIFSPMFREHTFEGRGVEDMPELPKELDWQNNIKVYRAGVGLLGRHNDKAHLKLRYFEYLDPSNVTHHIVVWGSANNSNNAAQLNADGLYIFKSADPKVGEIMRPFIEALEKDSRMQKFSHTYLERWLSELFVPRPSIMNKRFLERFSKFLSGKGQRRTLNSLINSLEKAGVESERGKNVIKLLRWTQKYRPKITDFSWEDWEFILRMTSNSRPLAKNVIEDIENRWLEGLTASKRTSAMRSLRRITSKLGRGESSDNSSGNVPRELIQQNCQSYLKAVRSGKGIKRKRFPFADVEIGVFK
jgi:hypothetical protein